MSSCTFMRKPKVKHETKATAYEHLNSPGNSGIHQRQVYRCPKCQCWHIGRIPTPNRLKQRNNDEILVGILIGALKATIQRSDLVATDKEARNG